MRRDGNVGLFNTTAESAHIRAVTIADGALYGTDTAITTRIGILVGQNSGQITESTTSGAVTSGTQSATLGGLAGENFGEIARCSASVTLLANTDRGAVNIGGLVGTNRSAIRASFATGQVLSRSTTGIAIRGGGLVGTNVGDIIESYATGAIGNQAGLGIVGGLVGRNGDDLLGTGTDAPGSIIASYATGMITGSSGTDSVGGLVGENTIASDIIASYATGDVAGGGGVDNAGGLVGSNISSSIIIASYATGAIDGGGRGSDNVGGLVGSNTSAQIIASYATGNASGGEGAGDVVGGLLGLNSAGGTIIASYATGDADGETANGLVGFNFGKATESYHFGMPTQSGQTVTAAATLQITDSSDTASDTYAGAAWNSTDDDTADAWDFGTTSQAPALRYADYDGADTDYTCDMFPDTIPGTTMTLECDTTTDTYTLLPGQER